MPQLVESSDLIVKGQIHKRAGHFTKDNANISTTNFLEITQVFKGLPSARTIAIETVGGYVDGQFQIEIHSTQLPIEQEGYYFIENTEDGIYKMVDMPSNFTQVNEDQTVYFDRAVISNDLFGFKTEMKGLQAHT